jgi:hypothetical protein
VFNASIHQSLDALNRRKGIGNRRTSVGRRLLQRRENNDGTALQATRMKTFQVRQTIHYDLTIAAGTEQEAILKAGGIPLTQWDPESTEITAELIDETEELDEY